MTAVAMDICFLSAIEKFPYCREMEVKSSGSRLPLKRAHRPQKGIIFH
jgi:hypothetical protein